MGSAGGGWVRWGWWVSARAVVGEQRSQPTNAANSAGGLECRQQLIEVSILRSCKPWARPPLSTPDRCRAEAEDTRANDVDPVVGPLNVCVGNALPCTYAVGAVDAVGERMGSALSTPAEVK